MNYGKRISVVGTSGSGKTTLARIISQRLAIPHLELDAIYHQPNWTETPLEVFRQRVEEALKGDSWVVDGNYSKVRDIVWSRADTVIWLDYSLPLIMKQIVGRTLRRVITQEELWNGNRETWGIFFSKYSMPLWVLQTYQKNQKEYAILLNKPEYGYLKVVHLLSPKTTQTWLSNL
ncbi:MAG: ATP-binding cassette domain-containing protein [Coleofasciculaceae cyanobacterium]